MLLECDRFFVTVAQKNGLDVTWNYDDVYNLYAITAEDKMMDASRFTEWLQDLQDKGQYTSIGLNKHGQLEQAFFTFPRAHEYWAQNIGSVSMHYDITFGTNRVGLKLGLGTCVDPEGHTRILFGSLLMRQNLEAFTWVNKHVLQAFRVRPATIFTDSDDALAGAIRLVFRDTTHLLCTWHLSLNLSTNVQPATGKAQFIVIQREWWRICKETDLISRASFDTEWDSLVALVPKPLDGDDEKLRRYDVAMKWFAKIKERKEQWAARWTWSHLTLGTNLTLPIIIVGYY